MSDPLLGNVYLDNVLSKFKLRDRYHAVAMTLMSVAFMLEHVWGTNYVITVETVGYRCAKFSSESKNVSRIFNMSEIQNTTITWCENPDSCSEWAYDNPKSFVAELACHDWKRTSVGSIHNFGYMLGVLGVGALSDRFGRKTMIIITCVTGGTLGFLKSFATSYWFYVALEFMEAAMGDPVSPSFTLAIEMVATESRVTYTTACMVGLGVGGMLFAPVAWFIPYWRNILRAMYAPGLLALSYIYLIDESPRWLLANGKKNEAVKIIRKAAKRNKIELNEDLNNFSYENKKGPSFAKVIKDTFKSPCLSKRFFVCSIWWISVTFVNYGLLVNSATLGGNRFLNYGLVGVVKILGIFFAAYIVNKYNRKGPLMFCFMACAVLCTGQPFLPKDLLWLQISIYMLGLLLSCTSFYIIYIFTSELFPTQSRNSLHALCSATGRLGSIMAPQTPLLMAYWSGLPTVVFGVVSLTAGFATLLVPDTANETLPDTMGQAEKIGS